MIVGMMQAGKSDEITKALTRRFSLFWKRFWQIGAVVRFNHGGALRRSGNVPDVYTGRGCSGATAATPRWCRRSRKRGTGDTGTMCAQRPRSLDGKPARRNPSRPGKWSDSSSARFAVSGPTPDSLRMSSSRLAAWTPTNWKSCTNRNGRGRGGPAMRNRDS